MEQLTCAEHAPHVQAPAPATGFSITSLATKSVGQPCAVSPKRASANPAPEGSVHASGRHSSGVSARASSSAEASEAPGVEPSAREGAPDDDDDASPSSVAPTTERPHAAITAPSAPSSARDRRTCSLSGADEPSATRPPAKGARGCPNLRPRRHRLLVSLVSLVSICVDSRRFASRRSGGGCVVTPLKRRKPHRPRPIAVT